MVNARSEWHEAITATKVELSRNMYNQKCAEERIHKREEAKAAKARRERGASPAVHVASPVPFLALFSATTTENDSTVWIRPLEPLKY